MGTTTRTFVAVELGVMARSVLGLLSAELQGTLARVRWIDFQNYHLTLAFLGEVETVAVGVLGERVDEAVRGMPAFELKLAGVGVFPNARRPRVIWAGVRGNLAALQALQEAVQWAVRAAGWPATDARFSAHVTLGRFQPHGSNAVRGMQIERALAAHAGWTGGTVIVDSVVIYRSEPGSRGPRYTALSLSPLRGSETGKGA